MGKEAGNHRDAGHHQAPDAIGEGSSSSWGSYGGGEGAAHRQDQEQVQGDAEAQAGTWKATGNAERYPGA